MTTEEILARFDRVEAEGGKDHQWNARCPAHDDKSPSLSIARGDNGATLLHCQAGCDINEITSAIGIEKRDLFDEPTNGHTTNGIAKTSVRTPTNSKRRPFGKIVETYSYRDEDGEELFEVVRLDPKDFRQRRKKEDGSWSWSTKDVRKVLYRLPELLSECDTSIPVVFCEGEKDAEVAAKQLPATTLPGGAKAKPPKWFNDALRPLRGRKVAIVPDNDKPGRLHAENVSKLLAGHADVRIVPLPGVGTKGDFAEWANDRDDWAGEFVRMFEDADPFVVDDEPADGRRQIELIPGQTHKAASEAMAALATDSEVYSRAGRLVRVGKATDTKAGRIERDADELRVIELSESVLKCRLSAATGFFKWVKRGDQFVAETTDCPVDVVRAVRTDGIFPSIRELKNVVTVPVMRPDGSVLDEPGYDADTKLIFEPAGEIPRVPRKPTQADARAAAMRLADVFCDFPFESPAKGRAACVGAILALVGRPMIEGPCPAIVIDGNRAGTGKSMITDAIGIICGHNQLPRTSAPSDEAEWRKVITSTAIAGLPVILLDNLGTTLGSASFDAVLTGTEWRDRRLGGNDIDRFTIETVWFATGNNVAIRGDLYRRMLRVPLDCKIEDPEARTDFKRTNLLAWVRQNRVTLLADALTILRAWHVAGRPSQGLDPWGSYEAFTSVVRDSLVFAGLVDPAPASDRKEIQERSDSRRAALPALMDLWPLGEHSEPDEMTAGELYRLASDGDHPRLMDVLDTLVKSKNGVSAKSLGWTLREFKGQVVGGKRIEEIEGHSRQKFWTVRTV